MLLAIASLLFGVFTICHALDLTDAVATGKPWARPLAAMLLCLALTLAAHVITVNL